MGKLEFSIQRCKSCGLCVNICPQNVLIIGEQLNDSGDRYVVALHAEKCVGCGFCALTCPDMVIRVYKEEK